MSYTFRRASYTAVPGDVERSAKCFTHPFHFIRRSRHVWNAEKLEGFGWRSCSRNGNSGCIKDIIRMPKSIIGVRGADIDGDAKVEGPKL